LSNLDVPSVVTVEETCGPLARYWLPACYEDSPLADLVQFSAEPGNLALFKNDFEAFVASEADRQAILERTPMALSVENPEALHAWLETHAPPFRVLTEHQRRRVTEWLPLFQISESEGKEDAILKELATIGAGLESITASAPEAASQAVAVALSDDNLKTWLGLAEDISRPVSFWAKLSPRRWSKSSSLKAFFREQSLGEPSEALPAFIAASKYEIALRPWRLRLKAVMVVLEPGTHALDNHSGSKLLEITRRLESELSHVRALVERLRACPQLTLALAAIRQATPEALENYIVSARQGLERHEARMKTLSALSELNAWFNEDWMTARRGTIESYGSNDASLNRIIQAMPTLGAYQRFRTRAVHLAPLAIAAFRVLRGAETSLAALDERQLDSVVRRTIRREARLAWKARMEAAAPVLLLEADELEAKAAALEAADAQMRQSNRRLLIEGIDTRRLRPPREWEDITRLRGQRARRLREFLDRGTDLGLMTLRPVWLMNPDVASRVLPLKAGLFDTVIYDEASQIPVEYALPSLFRSKAVIVSGDEKQMPPTSFFSSRVENDEADIFEGDEAEDALTDEARAEVMESWNRREIKDCPDLLQLAKSVLPTTTLQVHYRSAYRELISFSNASFYRNSLSVPVRHPDDEVRRIKPIEMVHADCVYQDQINPTEAESVSKLLSSLWSGNGGARKSVGVVTFNRKQADLIEEVLETLAEEDDDFRNVLAEERERIEDGEDMGFFVKNVENVQGDERDIIIFSSTFGRNAQGTFRRSFGVLGQTGGERRLNVAVTRAREKVFLVTSMPIGEISDMLTTRRQANSPRDYLQAYFEYARAVSTGELENARALLERLVTGRHDNGRNGSSVDELDGFQEAVAQYIETLGWYPVDRREAGPFGIDFAIENPDTGLYAIGIDCDAPRHRLLAHARAREMWRPSVLKRSIPHVHRVSSNRWYLEPQNEQERLRIAIERALPGRTS
jgi:primosomal replication protein N''